MNRTYRIIFRLTITHDYYTDGVCPDFMVGLHPQSVLLFSRYQMLLKQLDVNNWVILVPDNRREHPGINESIILLLHLKNLQLLHFTNINPENEDVINSGSLSIPLTEEFYQKVNSGEEVRHHISFSAKQMMWKYIFVPRYSGSENKIELKDDSGQLSFLPQPDMVMGNCESKVFLSESYIPLKNKYDYKLRLTEVMRSGEKHLVKSLQLPRPDDYELRQTGEKHEILAKYIYY